MKSEKQGSRVITDTTCTTGVNVPVAQREVDQDFENYQTVISGLLV